MSIQGKLQDQAKQIYGDKMLLTPDLWKQFLQMQAPAMIYGTVIASFCCEGFGLQKTAGLTRSRIEQRMKELEKLSRF